MSDNKKGLIVGLTVGILYMSVVGVVAYEPQTESQLYMECKADQELTGTPRDCHEWVEEQRDFW